MRNTSLCCIILVLVLQSMRGQSDSTQIINYKNRKSILIGTSAVVGLGSLIYLNQQWYSNYNTGKFHFFNDNAEWLQMDKFGHAFTTYQSSRLMMEGFEWAGYNKKQTLFIGGTIGLAYMTLIEVMDGYSEGWGFSWGDMIANIAGTSMAISQKAIWDEQRFQIKYSFSSSGLAKYNPSLLGESFGSQLIKDYNAQTYWLNVNPSSFLKSDTKFPKWFNLSFGYSAYGMLGGESNQVIVQDANGQPIEINRQRRFYLSFDIDLTRIKTKSKLLKTVFSIVNILKVPAPSLEFTNTGTQFYFFYY